MFSQWAEEQFVVLILLGGSCRHCENSSIFLVTLPESEERQSQQQDRKGTRVRPRFPICAGSLSLSCLSQCLGSAPSRHGRAVAFPRDAAGIQQERAGAGMPLERGGGSWGVQRRREAEGGWVPQKQGFKDTGNFWFAFQIEMCMRGTAR